LIKEHYVIVVAPVLLVQNSRAWLHLNFRERVADNSRVLGAPPGAKHESFSTTDYAYC
jgi:hypothetical protein